MKIVDKLFVYKGEYGFSTSLKNGEDKMYIQVGFKKGQEPLEEKLQIDIKDGFLSFYKTKDGLCKVKIVVMEYVKILDNEVNYADGTPRGISDDELPF